MGPRSPRFGSVAWRLAVAVVVLLVVAPGAGAAVTERVSVGVAGQQADGQSFGPDIGADGRIVVFATGATNLGTTVTNIVAHDRATGANEAIDLDTGGRSLFGSEPAVSGDGRFVAFHASARPNALSEVFVRDRVTHETTQITNGGNEGSASQHPALSGDGRFVAFEMVKDLLPGDVNRASDVVVWDRVTGAFELISVSSAGQQGNDGSRLPAITPDGRFVSFTSAAADLATGDPPGDDVFIRDRLQDTTEWVSVVPSAPGDFTSSGVSSVSADGSRVAFDHTTFPLTGPSVMGVYVRDRQAHTTQLVAGQSFDSDLSADGTSVAFTSPASDLVPGDANGLQDVFVRDLRSGATQRVSVDGAGADPNGVSSRPAISADGRFVAFDSAATDLVPGDTNGVADVFVRDLGPVGSPEQLLAQLNRTIDDMGLPHGRAQSLKAKLRARGPVCDRLNAFANHVRAQAGKGLSAEQAARLLADAAAVQSAFGCP